MAAMSVAFADAFVRICRSVLVGAASGAACIAGSQCAHSALPNGGRSPHMIGALRGIFHEECAWPPKAFFADCSSEMKQGTVSWRPV
jgi:hypothetical protein